MERGYPHVVVRFLAIGSGVSDPYALSSRPLPGFTPAAFLQENETARSGRSSSFEDHWAGGGPRAGCQIVQRSAPGRSVPGCGSCPGGRTIIPRGPVRVPHFPSRDVQYHLMPFRACVTDTATRAVLILDSLETPPITHPLPGSLRIAHS